MENETVTDDELISSATYISPVWEGKSKENVEKWGLQSSGVLLLAIAEEVGEMAELLVNDMESDANDPNFFALIEAMKEVRDTGLYIQELHEDIYEDDDGEPIDGPSVEYTGDLSELGDELADTAALLYQLRARIDGNVLSQYE